MWRLIPGPIRRAVSWLLGALGFAALAWSLGRREGRQRGATESDRRQAQGYTDTRKRADDVEIHDDPNALRDWLRARDPRKP